MTVTLVYMLKIEGFNAAEINDAKNNDIASKLIVGVETILISILGQQQPLLPSLPSETAFFLPKNLNGEINDLDIDHEDYSSRKDSSNDIFGNQGRRRLAKYMPSVPPYHSSILQDQCETGDKSSECVLIRTVVTVYLEPDEDPLKTRRDIVNGFNEALNDGSFFKALPN